MIRWNKIKLVILDSTCPALRKSEIKDLLHWSKLVSIITVTIIINWAQNVENATEYALTVIDPGDSNISRSCQNRLVKDKLCKKFL
jgi:ribosomal protein L30E